MGGPDRTKPASSNAAPKLDPQPEVGNFGWRNSDGSETRIHIPTSGKSFVGEEKAIRTVYSDNSYISQVQRTNTAGRFWETTGKTGSRGKYGAQAHYKPQPTGVKVPADGFYNIKFDARYGQMGGKSIAALLQSSQAAEAPAAAAQPDQQQSQGETPATVEAEVNEIKEETPGEMIGRRVGLDPNAAPLGEGTIFSQAAGAFAMGYTPLLTPQNVFISPGGGGSYDQRQVSTSIFYEDDHRGLPITWRSPKGGVPIAMTYKDQTFYSFNDKLQYDEISNRQKPTRPLVLYDALPLGTPRQAVQPFRFKDVRLRAVPDTLNQIDHYAPPVQEVPGPAPPAATVASPFAMTSDPAVAGITS